MIFLDTGYFKGLFDKKDAHHANALKIKDYLDDSNETTVINTTVLVETLNRSFKTRIPVDEVYDDLYSENHVVELTNKDYLKAIGVSIWFGYSINYSDCTILNTMVELGINEIVSFDGAFKKIKGCSVIFSM